MQDRAATRRPQGGHAPRRTGPRRPVAPAGARARGERPRRGRAGPPRHAGATSPAPTSTARSRSRGMAGTVAPDLPQFLPTTWCGSERTTRRHGARRVPVERRADQGRLRLRAATRPTTSRRGATRCRPTSRASSSTWRCRPAAGARCASTWAPSAARSTSTSRSCTCRNRARTTRDAPTTQTSTAWPTRSRAAVGPGAGAARRLRPGRRASPTRPTVWGIAQVSARRPRRRGQPQQRRRPDGHHVDQPGTTPDPSDWQPTVMLHEITHNLGGVQQTAPHHTSGWHCWDGEDVMCYPDGSPAAASLQRRASARVQAARSRRPTTAATTTTSTPIPAAGSYLATHWNVYTSAFMGACAQLGHGVRRQHRPHRPGEHRAADRRRRDAARRRAHRERRDVAQQPDDLRAAMAARRRRRLGERPGRDRPQLRWSPPPTRASPCACWSPRPTRTARRSWPRPRRRPSSRPRRRPTPKPAAPISLQHRRCAITRATPRARWRRRVVAVPAGREVRTKAAKVTVTAGTWRLRLCAGPKNGRAALRAVQARAHAHAHGPPARRAGARAAPRRARCG